MVPGLIWKKKNPHHFFFLNFGLEKVCWTSFVVFFFFPCVVLQEVKTLKWYNIIWIVAWSLEIMQCALFWEAQSLLFQKVMLREKRKTMETSSAVTDIITGTWLIKQLNAAEELTVLPFSCTVLSSSHPLSCHDPLLPSSLCETRACLSV